MGVCAAPELGGRGGARTEQAKRPSALGFGFGPGACLAGKRSYAAPAGAFPRLASLPVAASGRQPGPEAASPPGNPRVKLGRRVQREGGPTPPPRPPRALRRREKRSPGTSLAARPVPPPASPLRLLALASLHRPRKLLDLGEAIRGPPRAAGGALRTRDICFAGLPHPRKPQEGGGKVLCAWGRLEGDSCARRAPFPTALHVRRSAQHWTLLPIRLPLGAIFRMWEPRLHTWRGMGRGLENGKQGPLPARG